jgi:tRNA uridine 5-carbamoylmethylation protein Kti12
MNSYNFAAINDKEFEALSADLLSEVVGKRVERFKPGRDKGVDGRFFCPVDGEVIMQSKHWLASGLPALLRHLQQDELPKIQSLGPKRYILTTSLPLSRANKTKIAKALSPWIREESDICGAEDLTDLLARHPHVEQRHFKLWITSANALQAIVNSGVISRSRGKLEEVSEQSPLFVVTGHYAQALDKLNRLNTVIISGEPGAGKTMLAHQLCLDFAANHWEIYFITSIAEGENVYRDEAQQLFLFDDFLGRNYLEALGRQEDSQIVSFIRRVARDKKKRFMLTSRTTILNQGMQLAESFRIQRIERNEHVIEVRSLSPFEKAQILYNHLWYGTLSKGLVDELYKDRRYKEVIYHANFNPRLISFITDSLKVETIPTDKYWPYVKETLENPADVWAQVFNKQLDEAGRLIVDLVALYGSPIPDKILRPAFERLAPKVTGRPQLESPDLLARTLPVVTGALINRVLRTPGNEITYNLFSPSIGDYVIRRVKGNLDYLIEIFASLPTTEALRELGSMGSSGELSKDEFARVIRAVADVHLRELVYPSMVFGAAQLLRLNDILTTDDMSKVIGYVEGLELAKLDEAQTFAAIKVVDFIGEELGVLGNDAPTEPVHPDVVEQLVRRGLSWQPSHSGLVALDSVILDLPDERQQPLLDDLRKAVIEFWADQLTIIVEEEGIGSDVYDQEEADALTDTVTSYLSDKLAEYSFHPFSPAEFGEMMSYFDAMDLINNNQQRASQEYDGTIDSPRVGNAPASVADPIEDLFERSRSSSGVFGTSS